MRKDVNGLVMIVATLAIIAMVIGLVARHEVGHRQDRMRGEGVALANTLSRISLERLAPHGRELGPLSLIRASMPHSNFAYGLIVAGNGEGAEIVASVGGPLPMTPSSLSQDPAGWSSERLVEMEHDRGPVREFTSPILEAGRLAGHVRIGFWEPDYAFVLDEFSFHASLALLVFMMSPMAYLWLKREIAPLHDVAIEFEPDDDSLETRAVRGGAPSEAIEAIVDRFQALNSAIQARADSMSRERVALLASSKVIAHEKNRIELLLEAIPEAVLSLDETGKINLLNARAESLLRKSREELAGASPSIWCPSPDLMKLIARHSGSNGRLMRAEAVEITLDDLGQRHFSASVHPLSDTDGMAVVIRDITSQFVERETQAEFLAHMAHELKAPLNVMSMYSETLLGPDGADENRRIESLNVIHDEIDRLNGLINNIFSIGRIESGNVSLDRQRVRTREFLGDVFESVSRGGSDLSLEFELDLPDAMDPIFADKDLLSVALGNLLTNAIKYNREGGQVRLSAGVQEEGLRITVSDTGVGIREEDLDQLFEKFFRSEDESIRKIAGHGLGLALVKEIVSLHGGEIQVQSVFGEGSQFSFVFHRNAAIFREES